MLRICEKNLQLDYLQTGSNYFPEDNQFFLQKAENEFRVMIKMNSVCYLEFRTQIGSLPKRFECT